MAEYRRAYSPGGTFFFTVVTYNRQPFLCETQARNLLRAVIKECQNQWPFEIEAMVLLPDHLHTIWSLPENDAGFSKRWGWIKKTFTQSWLGSGHVSPEVSKSKLLRRRQGIWQVRFWEHQIRDERDMETHLDYIHYNPIRHRLATCPHNWPYSTFQKWVTRKRYSQDWCCACDRKNVKPMNFDSLPIQYME